MAGKRVRRHPEYLEVHGGYYRVRVMVPERLRELVGASVLRQSLGHASLRRANVEKLTIVSAFMARIADAKREAHRRSTLPELDKEALEWNAAITEERAREARERKTERPPEAFPWRPGLDDVPDAERFADTTADRLGDRLEAVAMKHGMGASERFAGIAKGTATPIAMHVGEWLRTTPRDAKRNNLNRRAVRKLTEWCEDAEVHPTVEAVTPFVAARFEDATFPAQSTPSATFASYRTALRSYWQWLHGRGIGPGVTPWEGRQRASFKSHRVEDGPEKRPFTDDEVRTLLGGPASQRLHDVMHVAALSGMRLGEIMRLRLRDCVDGVFAIRVAKTAAGKRSVPIHPQLVPIVARLLVGRTPDAWLIDGGLDEPPADAERTRGSPLTKEFKRYRESLQVDEKPEGHRQSNIDFHSFRRSFIDTRTRVLASGGAAFTLGTLMDVVGHDREKLGMTVGTYAGRAPLDEMRRCVEAVGTG